MLNNRRIRKRHLSSRTKVDPFACQMDEDLDSRTDSNESGWNTWNRHDSDGSGWGTWNHHDSNGSGRDTWNRHDSHWTEADDFACQMDADLDMDD